MRKFRAYYKKKALESSKVSEKKNYYRAAGIDFDATLYIKNIYLTN